MIRALTHHIPLGNDADVPQKEYVDIPCKVASTIQLGKDVDLPGEDEDVDICRENDYGISREEDVDVPRKNDSGLPREENVDVQCNDDSNVPSVEDVGVLQQCNVVLTKG